MSEYYTTEESSSEEQIIVKKAAPIKKAPAAKKATAAVATKATATVAKTAVVKKEPSTTKAPAAKKEKTTPVKKEPAAKKTTTKPKTPSTPSESEYSSSDDTIKKKTIVSNVMKLPPQVIDNDESYSSSSSEESILESESSDDYIPDRSTTADHRVDADKIALAQKRSRGRPRKPSDSSDSDTPPEKPKQAMVASKIAQVKKAEPKALVPVNVTAGMDRESRLYAADPAIAKVLLRTKNVFEIVTTQCNALRLMFDAIRDFSFGFYLVCDENGITYRDISESKGQEINGVLYGDTFAHYACNLKNKKEPLKIGITIAPFYAYIRNLTSNKNLLGIYIDEKTPAQINIITLNKVRNQLIVNQIPQCVPPESPERPPILIDRYKCIFTYTSTYFRDMFRNLSSANSEFIEFSVYNNTLTLTCINDNGKRSTITEICATIPDGEISESPLKFDNVIDEDHIYCGIFRMKQIVQFTRCTQNCQAVKIFLENDMPLAIQYDVSNHGSVTLCMHPVTIDE